ncbi:transglutaminase domain-containing protein [Ruminococcus sp. 5_1_39BFAA]|uniref:transglutaminase domain-containing protein n=1 Tax=Ruminococcus sp. 5_1_39BFAA TaxID=457412 RepID=UPI0035691C19
MRKNKKHALLTGLFLLCTLLLLSVPVQAAGKKLTNQWVTKKGNVYFYNNKGKKVTGLQKIGKYQYYFDSKGVQRSGWRKIKNNYYFFQIKSGRKAYMVKSKTINGIKLDAKGRADKKGSNLRKLKLMVEANNIVQKITKPTMTQTEKLKKCFDYTKTAYGYTSWRAFSNKSGWELDFAEDMFYKNRGDCVSYGCAFAFLANAVGAKNVYCVSSGGHGWAEIQGKVYDPDWALVSKVDTYFAMDYSLSGVQGRPNYKPNRTYVVKI